MELLNVLKYLEKLNKETHLNRLEIYYDGSGRISSSEDREGSFMEGTHFDDLSQLETIIESETPVSKSIKFLESLGYKVTK